MPTPNVSVVDLKFVPGRAVTVEEINAAIEKAAASPRLKGILCVTKDEINAAMAAAAAGPLKGVLAVTNAPVVSIDMNHVDASSTVALPQTQVIEGKLARVLSWYDNEWGFSTRMSDIAIEIAKHIQ